MAGFSTRFMRTHRCPFVTSITRTHSKLNVVVYTGHSGLDYSGCDESDISHNQGNDLLIVLVNVLSKCIKTGMHSR